MSGNSFVMPNDLSDLCRVCLQLPEESQYLDLTTIYDEDDNLTYGECFTICTQIDLSAGEGVPHHLCKSCGLELQMSYDFYKKIEESKRVIEQYRRQIEAQKEHNTEVLLQSDKLTNAEEQAENGLQQLIENKYVISYDEMELAGSSQQLEDETVTQRPHEEIYACENSLDEEETDLEVLNNLCQKNTSECRDEQEDVDNMEVCKREAEENEQLDAVDFQNMEALEEEETETLQIKCGDNILPIQITKYKTIECGSNENEEYVEYYESDENILEEDQQHEEKLDEDYTKYSNYKNLDLKWQNNVVAVDNKEYLPIEMDETEEQEEEILLEESSQDENNEGEEEEISKSKNVNKNNTTRKRHVGSYSCDYCQRVFPNYSRMKTHRRCHEADRPKFSCSQCSRIYATKQARDSHVQTAHEKSGYTCNICNKVFAIRKSLEIHVRYHTGDFPYACKLCDRKFAQVCHLNTHINVKHNKIRFSCDYPGCGKFFTSSTSLRNHEFTHGVMPFECEYCQQGYPAKAKLRVHVKRKHGLDLSKDQLEKMRKFHVMRSKVNLVQFVDT